MTTSRDDAGPAQLHLDEAHCTAQTSTRLDALSALDSTVYPLAVNVIGADAMHRLTAAGYRVAGTCRCCGAPLVDPVSVARRLGPVCAARTESAA